MIKTTNYQLLSDTLKRKIHKKGCMKTSCPHECCYSFRSKSKIPGLGLDTAMIWHFAETLRKIEFWENPDIKKVEIEHAAQLCLDFRRVLKFHWDVYPNANKMLTYVYAYIRASSDQEKLKIHRKISRLPKLR